MSTEKENEGLYLVCNGAICKCSNGVPCALHVTKNKKVYVNKKLLATSEDNVFETPKFGSCTANNKKPCAYLPSKEWEEYLYQSSNKYIVTEKSKIICPKFGGEITVIYHGQSETVTSEQYVDYEIDAACIMSCLVDKEKYAEQIKTEEKEIAISVNSIKLNKTKSPGTIKVRLNKIFTLTAYKDKKAENELSGGVSWAIYQKNDKGTIINSSIMLYEKVGAPFKMTVKIAGTYFIEGIGNAASVEKYRKRIERGKGELTQDKNCTIKFETADKNGIKQLAHDASVLEIADNDGKNVWSVRQGVPSTFTILPNLELDESEMYVVRILSNDVEVSASNYVVNNDKIIFTPPNDDTYYKIEVSLKANGEIINTKTYITYAVVDIVSTIEATVEGENKKYIGGIIRPGTTLRFKIKMMYNSADKLNLEKITWKLIDKEGNPIATYVGVNPTMTFNKEEECTVTADIKSARGILKKGTVNCKYKINVCYNAITGVSIGSDGGMRFIGKEYEITTAEIYEDYNSALDGKRTYALLPILIPQSEIKENEKTATVKFNMAGKYTLYALMNNAGYKKPATVSVEVYDAQVEAWNFCDMEGNIREYIALKQDFQIHLKVSAWANATIKVALWQHDREFNFLSPIPQYKELKIAELYDDKNNINIDFTLNADGEILIPIKSSSNLWTKYLTDKGKYSGDSADLYFTVTNPPQPCPADIRQPDDNARKGYFFSKKYGRYLHVTHKADITGFFADAEGSRLRRIVKYGEQIKIMLYFLNYEKEYIKKLKIKIYENKYGIDSLILTISSITADANGKAIININTNGIGIKEADHKYAPNKPRLFYLKIFYSDILLYDYPHSPGDEYDTNITEYSDKECRNQTNKKNAKSVPRNYMWQLKVAKETTLNNTLAGCSPVIIGEELVGHSSKKDCPDCSKDVTVEQIKQICVDEKGKCIIKDTSQLQAAINFFNANKTFFGLTTCTRKIHFIAQIAVETVSFSKMEEDFTYSVDALKNMECFKEIKDGAKKAEEWGYKDVNNKVVTEANQKNIANLKYAKENGNGNFESNDGWTYRGRGYIQLTGRETYRECSKEYNKHITKLIDGGNAVDWEKNPDDLLQGKLAMAATLAYWLYKNLRNRSDMGVNENALRVITYRVNGGFNALPERRRYMEKATEIISNPECVDYKRRNENEGTVVFISGTATESMNGYAAYPLYVYRGMTIETYKTLKSKNELPEPDYTTTICRDAFKSSPSNKRYGTNNECPPGIYYLNSKEDAKYETVKDDSPKFKMYLSDAKRGRGINGADGFRGGIAFHGGTGINSEGCLTRIGGINELLDAIPDLFVHQHLKDKPYPISRRYVRVILEERQVEEVTDSNDKKRWKGIISK